MATTYNISTSATSLQTDRNKWFEDLKDAQTEAAALSERGEFTVYVFEVNFKPVFSAKTEIVTTTEILNGGG